jgi:hypothetical protein
MPYAPIGNNKKRLKRRRKKKPVSRKRSPVGSRINQNIIVKHK